MAINSSTAGDIYVALNHFNNPTQTGSFQSSYHPLVFWIWFGTILMIFGGLILVCSLWKKRGQQTE